MLTDQEEKHMLNCKTSLEDYQGQTRDRITKKLIRDVTREFNYDKLSFRSLKKVRDWLEGVFLP